MTAESGQTPLPASPCCPPRRLGKLASDGSTLVCVGCSRSYRADTLDDDHEPHIEELMEAPATPQGSGGGRTRYRRRPKAGERAWQEQRRRERRHEQLAAEPLGAPDREKVARKNLATLKLSDQEAHELEAVSKAAGISKSELIRRGLSMVMGVAAVSSQLGAGLRDRAAG